MSFVVLGGIGDVVVFLLSLGVGTETNVNGNAGFTGLGSLGGDKNNTVGSACTLKCV